MGGWEAGTLSLGAGCKWAGCASSSTAQVSAERSGAILVCGAKGLGTELGVLCQQNAASSTEQTERAAGSLSTAGIVHGS